MIEWTLAIIISVFVIRLVWYKLDARRLEADADYIHRAGKEIRRLLPYSQKFPQFDQFTTTEIAEASLATLLAAREAETWKVPPHCKHKHAALLAFLDAVAAQWDDVPNITDEEANRRMDRLKMAAEECMSEMGRHIVLPKAKERNVLQAFLFGYGR